jgi:hypothetical protein
MVPRTWGKLWQQAKGKRNRTILRRRETTVTHDEYGFNFVTSFLEMSVLLGGDTQSRFTSLIQQRFCETANGPTEMNYFLRSSTHIYVSGRSVCNSTAIFPFAYFSVQANMTEKLHPSLKCMYLPNALFVILRRPRRALQWLFFVGWDLRPR